MKRIKRTEREWLKLKQMTEWLTPNSTKFNLQMERCKDKAAIRMLIQFFSWNSHVILYEIVLADIRIDYDKGMKMMLISKKLQQEIITCYVMLCCVVLRSTKMKAKLKCVSKLNYWLEFETKNFVQAKNLESKTWKRIFHFILIILKPFNKHNLHK